LNKINYLSKNLDKFKVCYENIFDLFIELWFCNEFGVVILWIKFFFPLHLSGMTSPRCHIKRKRKTSKLKELNSTLTASFFYFLYLEVETYIEITHECNIWKNCNINFNIKCQKKKKNFIWVDSISAFNFVKKKSNVNSLLIKCRAVYVFPSSFFLHYTEWFSDYTSVVELFHGKCDSFNWVVVNLNYLIS
jgi:hypothetical protein